MSEFNKPEAFIPIAIMLVVLSALSISSAYYGSQFALNRKRKHLVNCIVLSIVFMIGCLLTDFAGRNMTSMIENLKSTSVEVVTDSENGKTIHRTMSLSFCLPEPPYWMAPAVGISMGAFFVFIFYSTKSKNYIYQLKSSSKKTSANSPVDPIS